MSFTEELKFSEITKLLEAVVKTSHQREKYMSEYFEKLHKFRNDFIRKHPEKDSSLLPVLRIFLARDEKERSYGLAEKSLRQLYIKALNLNKSSQDAIKLTQCSDIDLPKTIGEVMKNRTSEGSLTVYEVDAALTFLSQHQKQSEQENELRRLIFKSSAIDQKWFSKLILKRMKFYIGIPKLLSYYHPKAYKLFLKYSHISKVVEIIENEQVDESLMEVTRVFEPIRSMLSQKVTSDSNKEFLKNEMYQETKMDGERFQLHMKNNEFRYYSRHGHDYSDGFNALLTPLIKFTTVVHSIILDGEMLVYDKIKARYNTKGETTSDVKHMKDLNSNLRPCFCVFDVLLFNDQSMLNQPYLKRIQLLNQLFEDREGVFVKTIPMKIRDTDHLVELFNVALNNEEEGIILKEAKSIYKPGERFGGWYKMKADYFNGELVKDFDCVVIGGSYENHYTKNWIQRYMLGAIEKQTDDSYHIYSIGEVVHGVTREERMRNSEFLKKNLIDHKGESEVSFENGKIFFGKCKPDAWIPPNKSLVLECRAAELEPSTSFKTDFTLRFPRIDKVRLDKMWDESCTLKEFLELCKGDNGRVQKTVMRQVHRDDIMFPTRKRKSNTSVAAIISKILDTKDELDGVKAIDDVLEGKEFCVITSSENLPSIKEMELMIVKHSGTITKNPRKGKTFALIAGKLTKFVESYMKEKVYNVIKADWLVKHFKTDEIHKKIPNIRPAFDFYFITEDMKISLKHLYDEHGDSYTEFFETDDQLKALIGTMKPCKEENLDLAELDKELVELGMPDRNFMRNLIVSFDDQKNDNVSFESAKLILQLRAGKIEANEDNSAQPIIVDKNCLKSYNRPSELIDFNWILDSNNAGKLLGKSLYIVKESL